MLLSDLPFFRSSDRKKAKTDRKKASLSFATWVRLRREGRNALFIYITNNIEINYIELNYIELNYIELNYIELKYIEKFSSIITLKLYRIVLYFST